LDFLNRYLVIIQILQLVGTPFGSTIKCRLETTHWILPEKDEGYDDKAKNSCDDGNYGYKEPNWEIKFDDILDEEWGVKLSQGRIK
jgi:hypothetical protein